MKNEFPGVCLRCSKPVAAGEGYVLGSPGDFSVTHHSCVPVVDLDTWARPWVRKLEYDL